MPLRDDQGRIIAILSSGQDITCRRQTENNLRLSEERYRMLIDHLSIGVVLLNRDLKILTANAQMQRWFSRLAAPETVGYQEFFYSSLELENPGAMQAALA